MVPLTIEGSYALHQMVRMRWPAWKALSSERRAEVAGEAAAAFGGLENSGVYSMLGHKGDLMLVHFRPTMDQLNQVELTLAQLAVPSAFSVAAPLLAL